MSKAGEIFANYVEYIGTEVIDKFGGSYQNYQTLGNTWRQKMPYSATLDDFIMMETRIFLRMVPNRDQNDLNLMHKVCDNIADFLSKYMAKKSSDLNRADVKQQLMKKLFVEFNIFVDRFKKTYKRPIDMENQKYVAANPGIVAIYKSLQQTK